MADGSTQKEEEGSAHAHRLHQLKVRVRVTVRVRVRGRVRVSSTQKEEEGSEHAHRLHQLKVRVRVTVRVRVRGRVRVSSTQKEEEGSEHAHRLHQLKAIPEPKPTPKPNPTPNLDPDPTPTHTPNPNRMWARASSRSTACGATSRSPCDGPSWGLGLVHRAKAGLRPGTIYSHMLREPGRFRVCNCHTLHSNQYILRRLEKSEEPGGCRVADGDAPPSAPPPTSHMCTMHIRGRGAARKTLRARDRGQLIARFARFARTRTRSRKRALGRLSSLLDHFTHGQRAATCNTLFYYCYL